MPAANDAATAAATRQEFLRECCDMGAHRIEHYHLYRDYYNGEQNTLLTDRLQLFLRRSGLCFAENFCETIVDTMLARMRLLAFTADSGLVEEDETNSEAMTAAETVSAHVNAWWQRNRMDARQGVLYDYATVEGDAFVIVDWNETLGIPRFTVNKPHNVKVVYSEDDPDTILYAVKKWPTVWQDTTDPEAMATTRPVPIVRMNIYWPDRVEKWFTAHTDGADTKANWHPWMDEGDKGWPIMLTHADGSPLGVPVVHFANKPRGGNWGRSELHSVLPQQDGINKLIIDLHAVTDNEGAERWATGIPDASRADLKRAPGEVWIASDATARFGQFEAPQIAGLLEGIGAGLTRMSARSHTPLHLLNPVGALPSGETLKTAEAPLASKVDDRDTDHGESWCKAQTIAIRWHNTFGTGPTLDETVVLTAEWDQPESRNDESESRTALNWFELGASRATLLARGGFNAEEELEARQEENDNLLDSGALGGGLPDPTNPPQTGGTPGVAPAEG